MTWAVYMEVDPYLSPLETMIGRHKLLEQIDNGVYDKRDLSERLDVSRTTIDRAVRELEQENILHRRNGSCEFTRFGRIAYSEFCDIAETFQDISNANKALSILSEESDLDKSILEGGNVKLANERAPVSLFRRTISAANSKKIQAMYPILFPQQLEFLCKHARKEADIHLLIHDDLMEILKQEYTENLETLNTHSAKISLSPELPQFGLIIVDADTVWVTIHRRNGTPHGLIENSNNVAVRRSQQLFKKYLNNAQCQPD